MFGILEPTKRDIAITSQTTNSEYSALIIVVRLGSAPAHSIGAILYILIMTFVLKPQIYFVT